MAPHHQHTPPHSQASQHMNSQGGGGGHAAPSPVQHPVTPGHPPPPQQGNQQLHSHPGAGQAHPATSGTPQPHVIYQHPVPMSQQGGHPPMQPSPHTPTSPQTMYPQTFVASPFFQTSQAPGSGMPQQQQNPQQQPPGGAPQLSFTHTQPHTTASHAHHQHSHMPGHQGSGAAAQAPAQIVMMPHNPHPPHQQVPAPGQLQHPGQHLQHAHQIPHQMAGVHSLLSWMPKFCGQGFGSLCQGQTVVLRELQLTNQFSTGEQLVAMCLVPFKRKVEHWRLQVIFQRLFCCRDASWASKSHDTAASDGSTIGEQHASRADALSNAPPSK